MIAAISHDEWDLLGEVQSDSNLGHYTHSCVGDLALCHQGFTISIDFETFSDRTGVLTGHKFVVSTGEQFEFALHEMNLLFALCCQGVR